MMIVDGSDSGGKKGPPTNEAKPSAAAYLPAQRVVRKAAV